MERSQQTIGPMIAHTSTDSARIWLRAGKAILDELEAGKKLVVRIFKADSTNVMAEQTFSFHADFDNVGLVEFGNLQADTTYVYRIGYIADESFQEIPPFGAIGILS